MNFFDPNCQEPPLSNVRFGICDDQNGTKAYTDINNQSNWIATVLNARAISLTFTAIDKCIINDDEEQDKGRCDGMLTSNEHLFFIELKDRRHSRSSIAIEQLASTVELFIAAHGNPPYKYKKVFACNRKSGFQIIDNELQKRFFKTYGFRIDVQAKVVIV